ncbi:MAG: branched-chain amino acid ABC transporter permease [Sneathiellaceae bacterium]
MEILQLVVSGITIGMVYGLVALGYHLIFRATQIIDFSQGEKVALGGLLALSAMLVVGDDLWLALIVATLVGFAIGWVYEWGILRRTYGREQVVQIIATVGVAQIFYQGHGLIWGASAIPFSHSLSGNPQAVLELGGARLLADRLWVWGLVILVVGLLHVYFERTRHGQAMIAAADNRLGAQLSGIDVGRMRSQAVAVATALAVLGGVVIAPFTLAGGSIGLPIAVKAFAGAMIGGLYSPLGVVAGSLLVGIIESLAAGLISYGYRDPVAFGLLLVVLLVRPSGLFGRRLTRVG